MESRYIVRIPQSTLSQNTVLAIGLLISAPVITKKCDWVLSFQLGGIGHHYQAQNIMAICTLSALRKTLASMM